MLNPQSVDRKSAIYPVRPASQLRCQHDFSSVQFSSVIFRVA